MTRGHLLFPLLVEIARIDTAATAEDPDGSGALVSGYDPDFREPVIVAPPTGSARGASARQEMPLLRVRAQVEMGTGEQQRMMMSGQSPQSSISVVMHFRDLERKGLVDRDTGDPLFRLNDRLNAIYSLRGILTFTPRVPLYCVLVEPRGIGLGGKRNLLLLRFQERATSVRSL